MNNYVLNYYVYKNPAYPADGIIPHLEHEFEAENDDKAREQVRAFCATRSRTAVSLHRVVRLPL